ncbi:5-(carboxyamino)imidazole ribonucleotide mutase [Caldinitratiruptor microaerophilus]|uniref:N5-carboxyaminoimidazole ribonucleotide mutase n=1 Tax=Caldinitratiruptor microaerophilus TaxID=671077 RepID=A0AA35CL30_9FIRM|nr:5-(carboxyamino)imidazole ribonucleotide mutase [Caldinitratiruptor microaerophilus]BDG61289.1 N5-carboxyaminoimidazole ribonucleotide mutase [Caldinitratiruptor microaerophilus]
MARARVGVILGSESDLPRMQDALAILEEYGIPYELAVASAHRSPRLVQEWAGGAEARGLEVIIAAAGMAAHLPGVVAAWTPLPVIGVPLGGSSLGGVDALYSIVQMPPGVPVATVAVDGARNAAHLAAQILAVADPALRERVRRHKAALAAKAEETFARYRDRGAAGSPGTAG